MTSSEKTKTAAEMVKTLCILRSFQSITRSSLLTMSGCWPWAGKQLRALKCLGLIFPSYVLKIPSLELQIAREKQGGAEHHCCAFLFPFSLLAFLYVSFLFSLCFTYLLSLINVFQWSRDGNICHLLFTSQMLSINRAGPDQSQKLETLRFPQV